jgi:hypothetical protein
MADDAHAFSPILYFSPEMVAELALGAEHPHEIAERYGYEAEDYEHLAAQPWFAELVVRKRVELHDDGALFQHKAAMMAETLFVRLFQQSMVGALAAPLTVEVAKQLSDIGRLKPQPANIVDRNGPPFQINIMVEGREVISSSERPLMAAPIDAFDVTPSAMTLEFPTSSQPAPAAAPPSSPRLPPDVVHDVPADPIPADFPPPPTVFRVPDFDLRRSALVGTVAAVAAATASQPVPPGTPVGLPSTPASG